MLYKLYLGLLPISHLLMASRRNRQTNYIRANVYEPDLYTKRGINNFLFCVKF